jgi:Winged helix DNA-binding domain
MDGREVAHRRMRAQHLVGTPLRDPAAVVGHLGGVQAQEFRYALWGVAQRTTGFAVADVHKLVDDGAIVRTHALRPTWHFLAPEDLGWIQALTGPRVHAFNAYYYRQHGIDAESAAHTNALITAALRGGNHLTRKELGDLVGAAGNKLAYIVMHAELDGLIVNGPMRGKQHTYALAEERIPAPRELSGDEALAELTRRYFSTHGPATIKDFVWWSSLTVAQIKRGLALAGSALATTEINGLAFWYDHTAAQQDEVAPTARLLQGYDEYVVAYSNTKFAYNLGGLVADPQRYTDNMMFHPIIVDSQLAGFWRRPQGRLDLDVVTELTAEQRTALDAEVARLEAAIS